MYDLSCMYILRFFVFRALMARNITPVFSLSYTWYIKWVLYFRSGCSFVYAVRLACIAGDDAQQQQHCWVQHMFAQFGSISWVLFIY